MKYRVIFRERTDQTGERFDNPPDFLDVQLPDGTVLDAVFVGRNRPEALHSSDRIEEDDGFLSVATEIWEYDVAEGRDEDFKNALLNSGVVIEVEPLESSGELGIS